MSFSCHTIHLPGHPTVTVHELTPDTDSISYRWSEPRWEGGPLRKGPIVTYFYPPSDSWSCMCQMNDVIAGLIPPPGCFHIRAVAQLVQRLQGGQL